MTDKEIEKWFNDNHLSWSSEWVDRVNRSGIYSPFIRNEIWSTHSKLLEYWESTMEPSLTDRFERARKHVRDGKLTELGI